ncbi:hypothetical protein EDD85DRAFT_434825 [Armillaria nabsnona]|nr:hypothetical protein EDD85DRAFT_434825 [Armillaria nabsnona]
MRNGCFRTYQLYLSFPALTPVLSAQVQFPRFNITLLPCYSGVPCFPKSKVHHSLLQVMQCIVSIEVSSRSIAPSGRGKANRAILKSS